MKALIFAAGLGTRLKPLTDRMPKALVPVGGVPLLEQTIIKLRSCGYDDIVVNVHHFADQIEDFLKQKSNFGIKISISDERDMLRETGGGIRHAAPLLADAPEGRFLEHNVDIISNLDVEWFDAQWRDFDGHIADILVSDRKTSRYFLFDDGKRLVGWTNVSTGEVRSPYGELDVSKYRKLAFAGIHNISVKMLKLMESWPEAFPIVDFYLAHCADYTIRGIEAEGLELHDVGKIADLALMNKTK